MKDKLSTFSVQSLSRGLKLLDAVVAAGREVSNAELEGVLPVQRSSTFRLLQTLVSEGYLRQNKATKRYAAGRKILEMANHLTQSFQLVRVCHPHLEELTALTGETSHCAVLSGPQAMFLDHVLSPHAIGVTMCSGRMEPVHCTALGKALVVDSTEAELRRLLDGAPLKAYTAKSITSWRGFFEEMKRVRGCGFATDHEEYAVGVRCLAAPVRDFSSRCIGAIGISGPSARLTTKAMTIASRHVLSVARRLCATLGYRSR